MTSNLNENFKCKEIGWSIICEINHINELSKLNGCLLYLELLWKNDQLCKWLFDEQIIKNFMRTNKGDKIKYDSFPEPP